MTADLISKIYDLISPAIEPMGYRLVLVNYVPGKVLELVIDKLDFTLINISDCERVSHTASALLDVEDLIPDRYNLQVSSPGIDRPLITVADYLRFKGHLAKIWLKYPEGEVKRRQGIIVDADDRNLTLQVPSSDQQVTVPFTNIDRAKLMMTDELIKAMADLYGVSKD